VAPGSFQPNVAIGETSAFLDPTGYRAPMIFRLLQSYYKVSNLYDDLLDHLLTTAAQGSPSVVLGQGFDFEFVYEVSAYAALQNNPDFRYVNLPDEINLGNPRLNEFYRQAEIVVPDLLGTGLVAIPGNSVIYGVTIMRTAQNHANAITFLQYLLGSNGQADLKSSLFKLISPAKVSREDYRRAPGELRPYDDANQPTSSASCSCDTNGPARDRPLILHGQLAKLGLVCDLLEELLGTIKKAFEVVSRRGLVAEDEVEDLFAEIAMAQAPFGIDCVFQASIKPVRICYREMQIPHAG
jgi:Bacterial extracellular solute-binding protein